MAYTVQTVCNLALQSLNDQGARALNPTEQLRLFNKTMHDLCRERPDLFVGSLATVLSDKTLGQAIPYEDQFAPLHAHKMVAEALSISDEEENQGKAGAFLKRAAGP